MGKRILIVQGHPDALRPRYGHALAESYASGARDAGHEVQTLDIARLEFPLLRSKVDWDEGKVPANLEAAQVQTQ
jgi:putative NADPH-quinone reductase